MPLWYYWERPLHTACHDLTLTDTPPPNLKSLLGLGQKFCPTPKYSTYNIDKATAKFRRSAWLKHHFGDNKPDNEEYDPRVYIPSKWMPYDCSIDGEYALRIYDFIHRMQINFRK